MSQVVMITGAGRSYALGYNFVLRYLENGDIVIATVRKMNDDLRKLKEIYKDQLYVLIMDIGDTKSVEAAAIETKRFVDHIDLLINNAVTVSSECDKEFFDVDLDLIAHTFDVTTVGTMRVIQKFYPLLKQSNQTALIINISSEAGSISKCYRTNLIEYGMAKAAINMGTMNLYNLFKDDPQINIFCVHPGWIRTDGKEDNEAPLSSYEAAEILKNLFELRREDKIGHRFITNLNEEYPF